MATWTSTSPGSPISFGRRTRRYRIGEPEVFQRSAALAVIGIGIVLIVLGALGHFGALSWFGRLPGDIRVERPGFRLYVPFVSMLIVSAVLTLLAALMRRFWS